MTSSTTLAADKMARIIDEMVRKGQLDCRSPLADARLDYGEPWQYKSESDKVSLKPKKHVRQPWRVMTPQEYSRDFTSFPPHEAVIKMAVKDEPASAEVSVFLKTKKKK